MTLETGVIRSFEFRLRLSKLHQMQKLVDRIQSEFSPDILLEVYVLDNNGDPYEVFTGMSTSITVAHLQQVLKEPGCFYVFSIIGIDKSYADSVGIQLDNIIRKEFCWLTDPSPPEICDRQSDSITVTWKPVSFCGIRPGNMTDSINYVLEIADGQPYRSGSSTRFISDMNAMKYRTMARGPKLHEVTVTELRPATWYYLRVAMEYSVGDTRVQSTSKPIPTLRSVPATPSKPRVHIIPGTKSFLSVDGYAESKVLITWMEPAPNGSPIEKYQLQLQELESNPTAPRAGSNGIEEVPIPRWQNAYCNLTSETILSSPRPGVTEWLLRVRAKNSDGWSEFSAVRSISKFTHPSLFVEKVYIIEPAKVHQKVTASVFVPRIQAKLECAEKRAYKSHAVSRQASSSHLFSEDSFDDENNNNDVIFYNDHDVVTPNPTLGTGDQLKGSISDIFAVRKQKPPGYVSNATKKEVKISEAKQARLDANAKITSKHRPNWKREKSLATKHEEVIAMSKSLSALPDVNKKKGMGLSGNGGERIESPTDDLINASESMDHSASTFGTFTPQPGQRGTGANKTTQMRAINENAELNQGGLLRGPIRSHSPTSRGDNHQSHRHPLSSTSRPSTTASSRYSYEENFEDVFVRKESRKLKLDIPVSKKVLAYILEPTLRYIARQIEAIDS